MAISGVALLAICTLLGAYLGDLLGQILGVKANVGGVGIAMLMLISARMWLVGRKKLGAQMNLGVAFWGAIYIPIVVAMAATQNTISAIKSGPLVVYAAVGSVVVCFAVVALFSRFGGKIETMDELEARLAGEVK